MMLVPWALVMLVRFRQEIRSVDVSIVKASAVGPVTERIEHHEPWLTLYGLRLIFEKNVD